MSGGASLQLKRQHTNGTMSSLWAVKYADLSPGSAATSAQSGSMMGSTGWLYAQIFVPAIDSESAVLFEGIFTV